jgi:hypothetical protein
MLKVKLVVLLLMGVLVASCSSYRIEIHKTETAEYFVASRRIIPTTYPFPIWVEHYYSFNKQQDALNQINEWKKEEEIAKENRKRKFIYVK